MRIASLSEDTMTTSTPRSLTDWMQTLTGKSAEDIARAESRRVELAEQDATIRRAAERLDPPSRVA